jgi:puromycin-sensitive aminopeptidase
VQYPADLLNQFLPAIRSKSMPPLDRLGLLDDLFALVQSGQSSTVEVLNLLQAFVNEDNYTVWASISSIVGKLNLLMAYSDSHDEFKAFGRDLFSVVLKSVGWEPKENESHLQTMLRSLVLNRMSTFGDESTLKEANKRFALHVSGEQPIPADLRSAVYKSALSIGNEETFKTMLKLYRDADIQEEKDRIARSFGAIKDVNTLNQVLEFAISDEVRSQDTVTFFLAVGMGSKEGRDLSWNFFKDQRNFFQKTYPKGSMVSRLVKYVTENFVHEEKALDVEAFFREHTFSSTERTVQQATESIRLNEAWLKRDLSSIQNYLRSVKQN